VRDPFVNVVMTAGEAMKSEEAAAVAVEPPPPASLVPTTASERRNVVLILLESTRAQYTTPYDEDLDTTPFLNELAKSSLLAEQAYTVMPTTSKANVAANCGIAPSTAEPVFGGVMEAVPGGIPIPCLADLLRDQGYNTVFFMSTSKNFENFEDLQKNLGYESFYSEESMPEKDFDFKDDRMLKPSEEWLGNQKESGKPFLATYLTYDTHYPYTLPDSYEQERFADDEVLNRYLNTIRYQDQWLKNLFEQYKRLGLYEDTVFVLVGDHGEAFGEHGRSIHGNFLYEEGLSIPLIIHDPKRFANGNRVKDPVNQLDILPTVSELLGYQIEGGAYQGNSLLRPLPKDRTLFFSCFMEKKCIASLRGNIKYIHHFGDRSDEVFDLSVDPLEKHNLAEEERGKDLQKRRNELLAWRSKNANFYRTNLEGSDGQ